MHRATRADDFFLPTRSEIQFIDIVKKLICLYTDLRKEMSGREPRMWRLTAHNTGKSCTIN